MRNSFHRRPASAKPITGADRIGVQGDLSAVLDKTRAEKEDPRVERPLVMIRSIRYVGDTEGATPAAAMSAKSHALYEFLMASARTQIATTEDHSVPFSAAMAYLDTPRTDRIREYIDAISNTYVSYDFTEEDGTRRAASRIQLLQCEEVLRPTGEREIGYRMHPSVRKVILAATQYAHLEVAAFARFRCKYSARLYPKLAYVAGLDERHPLVYKPEDLAEELGWRGKNGKFHWGHFEADCLRPAMDDMFGADDGSTPQKVRRFVAHYELNRAATRGRPVESVIFHVGKAQRMLDEQQKPKIVSLDRERVRQIFAKAELDHTLTPSEELLAQSAGKLQIGISAAAERWAATMSLAKSDPDFLIGSLGILTGRQLLEVIATDGIRAAVTKWLIDWKEPKEIGYRPGFAPAPKPQAVVVAPTPEPSLEPSTDLEISFADASVVRIEFDDEIRDQRWARQVISELEPRHFFSVGEQKKLRLQWNGNGYVDSYEVEVTLSEAMLRQIIVQHREIIEEVEYLA